MEINGAIVENSPYLNNPGVVASCEGYYRLMLFKVEHEKLKKEVEAIRSKITNKRKRIQTMSKYIDQVMNDTMSSYSVSLKMQKSIQSALDIRCEIDGITKASFVRDAIIEKLGGPEKIYAIIQGWEEYNPKAGSLEEYILMKGLKP